MGYCILDNCNNKAKYGKITDYHKIYCKEHKTIEENLINIDVKNKYCKSCFYKLGTYYNKNDCKNKNNCYTKKELVS